VGSFQVGRMLRDEGVNDEFDAEILAFGGLNASFVMDVNDH